MHSSLEKIHHLLNKDLTLLFTSQFLKEIFDSLATVFIPIFLFKELHIALALILFVYGWQYFIYGFLSFFPFKYLRKHGVKLYVTLGTLLNALRFYFLYLSQTQSFWWFLAFVNTMLYYEFFIFRKYRVLGGCLHLLLP